MQAQEWAAVLGEFQPPEAQLQAEIDRLRKKQSFHLSTSANCTLG
jgi:hypothetical protein